MRRASLGIARPAAPGDTLSGKGAADPQVALLQLRHELVAQRTAPGRACPAISVPMTATVAQRYLQARCQLAQVAALQEAHQEVVRRRLEVLEEEQAQHRRQRQGQEQGAAQGEGVGVGHRAEDLPFRPAHGEQRDEGAHHDQRREEQRPRRSRWVERRMRSLSGSSACSPRLRWR